MPARIPGSFFARNLIERRSLIFQLVKRDFQQRYVGSVAGWLWGLIHPLVLLVSYWFIFSVCLKTTLPEDEVTQNYPLFLFAGLLPWLLFSETVQRSSSSLVEQANLITRTVFPAEILPVAIFLSSLVSHMLAVGLVMVTAAVMLGNFSPMLLLLPIYVVVTGLFAIGIGWVVSSLQVYLRDTAQVVMVLMTFWFWLTPVFIAEKQFPEKARFLLTANPISYVVRAYRTMLLGQVAPSMRDLGTAAAFAVIAFVLGGLFFRYMKRGFADVL